LDCTRTSSPALTNTAAGVLGVDGSRQLTTAQSTSELRVHECAEILLGTAGLHQLDFAPQNLLGVPGPYAPAPERIQHIPDGT
jgi:hypothetical protein